MATGDVTVTEAHERRDEVLLLDVREPGEWRAGHVEGAVHVPMGQLGARLDELGSDRPIVCICRSGGRSAAVANALREAGYDAANMLGGMQAWAHAGLPYVAEHGGDPTVA